MISRFGVSIDASLLEKFDSLLKKKGYTNRSEALNDILREYVMENDKSDELYGLIRIVADPRIKSYRSNILELQNNFHCMILDSLRKYIDHHHSLELLIVKGKKERINKLVEHLQKEESVKEVKFEVLNL
jgi:CopG family nickel-responsive transcriptional regulator